ncbi:MAG: hypothetical protein IT203_03320 [Fimbriimonadaceae bacterium]|nr:hypothetical protein [Fimbriimonadaceae bacterium]
MQKQGADQQSNSRRGDDCRTFLIHGYLLNLCYSIGMEESPMGDAGIFGDLELNWQNYQILE